MSGSLEDNAHEAGKLKGYCQVVNYLLETYATDDVVAEDEADITNYEHPKSMSAMQYLQAMWKEALRCGQVYSDSRLKRVLIEGVHHSTGFSLKNDWAANQEATLQKPGALCYLFIEHTREYRKKC